MRKEEVPTEVRAEETEDEKRCGSAYERDGGNQKLFFHGESRGRNIKIHFGFFHGKRNNIVPDGNRAGQIQHLCNLEGRGFGEQSVASSHGAHGYRSRIRFQGGIYGTGGCGLSLRARKL